MQRRMKKTLLTLSAILVAGSLAVPSFADDKSDSDEMFEQGVVAYKSNDLEGARKKFAEAYAKYPSPNSLFNLARVEQVLGKNLDAYRHYQAYSDLPENPKVSPAERAEAKQRIQEILTKIGRIVIVAPQGAKVVLDGVALENQTESVPVEPGAHSIDLIVMSETRKKSVSCGAGEIHQVKWEEGGLQDGGAEAPRSPLVTAGLVVGGFGVLGLVSGFAFGMASAADADQARAHAQPGDCVPMSNPNCAGLQSKIDEGSTFNTVSIVSWMAGGVALAGGITMVTLGLMHRKRSPEMTTTLVTPFLLPGGGAVGLRGQF